MALVDVLNNIGDNVSQLELSDTIFGVPVNKSILHQVVVAQLSGRRAGTVGVKGRSDVVGSGRKLYRQKGTGRARKGDIKSPLLRGGGVIFGPTTRSYNKKIMKRVGRAALKMALTIKLKEEGLIILSEFGLTTPRTKAFVEIMKNLKAASSLIVTSGRDEILEYSSRNVPGIKVLRFQGMNVVDILKYPKLVIIKSSLKGIEGRLL